MGDSGGYEVGRRSRKVVMLVEAEPARRKYLYDILKLTRVDVVSCANEEEAMLAARRDQPSLILLNMFSDETEGMSFLRQLRCYALGRQMIVLGMVGDEDESLHKAASLAGADKLLERNPAPYLVLELVAGYLKIQKIEVPGNMRQEVGGSTVHPAPTEALDADRVSDPDGADPEIKPIIKCLNSLLQLTEDAGKNRA
ncbi:MAG: response regulator [Deltaproteobacteria bacterium]|nr:response regulator [Deltaproteobacteria bacterium]